MVAGVARGVSRQLNIPAIYVRIAFVLVAGVVAPIYLLAWALVPTDDGRSGFIALVSTEDESSVRRGVAFGSIVLGVVLLLRRLGIWFPQNWLIPMVLVSAGVAMVWNRPEIRDSRPRQSLTESLSEAKSPFDVWRVITSNWDSSQRASSARVVIGGVLVMLGVSATLASGRKLSALRDAFFGGVLLLGGAALIVGPWLVRLVRDLGSERKARARADAQAEIATHLHDSVLQTLAIIQRRADQPREVVTLARRQERELRAWLYGAGDLRFASQATTLAAALDEMVDEVEDTYGIRVEVVNVGDTRLTDSLQALVSAGREAVVNAAKHAGVDVVSVYIELGATVAEMFVRDRGKGFVQETIADDRRGLRDSIIGRVERVGGSARVISEIGLGTEVHISVPRLMDYTANPESSKPETSKPNTSKPESPNTSKLESPKPETSKPETSKPESPNRERSAASPNTNTRTNTERTVDRRSVLIETEETNG
jgi:signal transduction histidine kinase